MLSAKGPGRIAFSHDRAGEAMALPVEAGASIDVAEGHMLMASESVELRLVREQRLVCHQSAEC